MKETITLINLCKTTFPTTPPTSSFRLLCLNLCSSEDSSQAKTNGASGCPYRTKGINALCLCFVDNNSNPPYFTLWSEKTVRVFNSLYSRLFSISTNLWLYLVLYQNHALTATEAFSNFWGHFLRFFLLLL